MCIAPVPADDLEVALPGKDAVESLQCQHVYSALARSPPTDAIVVAHRYKRTVHHIPSMRIWGMTAALPTMLRIPGIIMPSDPTMEAILRNLSAPDGAARSTGLSGWTVVGGDASLNATHR
jgi:hypothetical protein